VREKKNSWNLGILDFSISFSRTPGCSKRQHEQSAASEYWFPTFKIKNTTGPKVSNAAWRYASHYCLLRKLDHSREVVVPIKQNINDLDSEPNNPFKEGSQQISLG